jgi:hypothetical protein
MKRLMKFAVCLDNSGNEASLIPGKIYAVLGVATRATVLSIFAHESQATLRRRTMWTPRLCAIVGLSQPAVWATSNSRVNSSRN